MLLDCAYSINVGPLDAYKNSHNTPDTLPTKLSKAPFVGFDGSHTGHIEKKIIDAAEARRQKVIAMLEAAPDTQRAILADDTSDPHNVILTVAVRAYQQTCEMLIPKAKYDPWRLLELIERHCGTMH
jgi:hypothetical protein